MEILIIKQGKPDEKPCDFSYKSNGSWYIHCYNLREFSDIISTLGPFSVMSNLTSGFEILLDEETYNE